MTRRTTESATSWLRTLLARGVTCTLRNNRLWLHPAKAFSELSDDELLFLRHHREAIKVIVRGGRLADDVVARSTPTRPPVDTVAPVRPITPSATSTHPEPFPLPGVHQPVTYVGNSLTLAEWQAREERIRRERENPSTK